MVKMKLQADFPDELAIPGQQYDNIRDVFTTLGVGKMVLSAEPVHEDADQQVAVYEKKLNQLWEQ